MAEIADDGVKEPVEIETTTAESPTEEPNDDGIVVIGDDDVPAEKTDEEPEQPKGEPEPAEEPATEEQPEEKTEEPQSKNAETRKQQLNNEIRDKVAERNALRREIAELNRQKYQMKSVSDLPTVEAMMEQINPETGDYYTRTEAKLARIEAERELESKQKQMDEFTENVVDNRMRLKDEADRVIRDFPMFDETSPSYDKDLAEKAERVAEGLIIKDESGEVIGSRGSIYDVYALVASATESAKRDGEIAGRKAAEKMMNAVDIPSANSPVASDDDDENNPFLRGFKQSAARYN